MSLNVEDYNIEAGEENGRRWICGEVPVGKGRVVWVDTRSGEGIEEVLNHLRKFTTYQASKLRFPSFSKEDIEQEINLLALEAIPKYDITRKSNMITFLQNHIRNRLINLCKFVSEKRRRATYSGVEYCKVKCPKCKRFTKFYNSSDVYKCNSCSHTGSSKDPSWRKYNMPIATIPFSSLEQFIDVSQEMDAATSFAEIVSSTNSDLAFVKDVPVELEDRVQKRVDFMQLYDKLDEVNQKIILMVLEGYTYKHIAKKVGISEKAAYARASKIMKGEKRQ